MSMRRTLLLNLGFREILLVPLYPPSVEYRFLLKVRQTTSRYRTLNRMSFRVRVNVSLKSRNLTLREWAATTETDKTTSAKLLLVLFFL